MQYLIDDASDVPLHQFQQSDMHSSTLPQHQRAPTTTTKYNPTLWTRWQQLLDQSSIYVQQRWGLFAFLTLLFMYRIIHLQGFYIIAYGLGLFELNLLIGFLTPLNENELVEDSIIPIHNNRNKNDSDEFKPFMRRLPEFQFWYVFITIFSFFSVTYSCIYL